MKSNERGYPFPLHSQHRKGYFDKCEAAIQKWRKDGPKPLNNGGWNVDGKPLEEDLKGLNSGLWLFVDRNNITKFFKVRSVNFFCVFLSHAYVYILIDCYYSCHCSPTFFHPMKLLRNEKLLMSFYQKNGMNAHCHGRLQIAE